MPERSVKEHPFRCGNPVSVDYRGTLPHDVGQGFRIYPSTDIEIVGQETLPEKKAFQGRQSFDRLRVECQLQVLMYRVAISVANPVPRPSGLAADHFNGLHGMRGGPLSG